MTIRKDKKSLKHWPPHSWSGVETDPIKIFHGLRQPRWNIIKCPLCGKVAIAHSSITTIIHFSKDHVATYEVISAGLTWKQAREMAGDSDIFEILTKENTPKAWKRAVRMLDDLAGVDRSKFEKK